MDCVNCNTFFIDTSPTECEFALNFHLIGFCGFSALVDTLVAKTRAWEDDRGTSFTYDGVLLLAMLDEYAMLRHEREEEKRRLRVSFDLRDHQLGH